MSGIRDYWIEMGAICDPYGRGVRMRHRVAVVDGEEVLVLGDGAACNDWSPHHRISLNDRRRILKRAEQHMLGGRVSAMKVFKKRTLTD